MSVRISEATLKFFQDLGRNNTATWFQSHRDAYASVVKAPMRELVREVNSTLAAKAPEYAGDADHPISRPNRDVRFSTDKSPYHTHIAAVFPCRGLPKEEVAGFFLRLDADGVQLLGGAYLPDAQRLKAIRTAIAEDLTSFRRLIDAPHVHRLMGPLQGECLRRVPAGFAPLDPAADLLRHKQFYFSERLSRSATTGAGLTKAIEERLDILIPFVRWLDNAMESQKGRREC
jgi:uncharacterized protein (TIGR02453 family)